MSPASTRLVGIPTWLPFQWFGTVHSLFRAIGQWGQLIKVALGDERQAPSPGFLIAPTE